MTTREKRPTVQLPRPLYEAVRDEAERQQRTITTVVQIALDEWLTRQQNSIHRHLTEK